MQKPSVRIAVLTLLLVTSLASAVLLWTLDRRAVDAAAAADAVLAQSDRVRDEIAAIGAAQHGYVAPGQLDEPWFERATAHLETLRGQIDALRPLLRAPEAVAALDALAASIAGLEAADARTRENLSLGQELMAADVIFSDGRHLLEGMVARLRELQHAERVAAAGARGNTARARWAAFGVVMLAPLTIGVLLLRGPKAPAVPSMPDAEARPGVPDPAAVDVGAAAALCTDLSRVADTAALPPLFARAADLLTASGVTLWLSAGEQLFAVLGHGYSAEHLARFGPIARTADNVVAAAWRTGRVTALPGDAKAAGALVAPMFGPRGCIGVLALEVRDGREQDSAVQAVAAMVAAQLATAVAAWPAASGTPVAAPAEARTA